MEIKKQTHTHSTCFSFFASDKISPTFLVLIADNITMWYSKAWELLTDFGLSVKYDQFLKWPITFFLFVRVNMLFNIQLLCCRLYMYIFEIENGIVNIKEGTRNPTSSRCLPVVVIDNWYVLGTGRDPRRKLELNG